MESLRLGPVEKGPELYHTPCSHFWEGHMLWRQEAEGTEGSGSVFVAASLFRNYLGSHENCQRPTHLLWGLPLKAVKTSILPC